MANKTKKKEPNVPFWMRKQAEVLKKIHTPKEPELLAPTDSLKIYQAQMDSIGNRIRSLPGPKIINENDPKEMQDFHITKNREIIKAQEESLAHKKEIKKKMSKLQTVDQLEADNNYSELAVRAADGDKDAIKAMENLKVKAKAQKSKDFDKKSKEHEKRFRFYQKYKDQLSEAEKIAFDNNKGIPQRFKDIYEAMN